MRGREHELEDVDDDASIEEVVDALVAQRVGEAVEAGWCAAQKLAVPTSREGACTTSCNMSVIEFRHSSMPAASS